MTSRPRKTLSERIISGQERLNDARWLILDLAQALQNYDKAIHDDEYGKAIAQRNRVDELVALLALEMEKPL